MLVPLEVDSLATLQSGFAASLLSAEKVADRRFFVHRNNVKASLGAALAARFPVVLRLVGVEFFRAMAVVFVERHPRGRPYSRRTARASPISSMASSRLPICLISPMSRASNGRGISPGMRPTRRRSPSKN